MNLRNLLANYHIEPWTIIKTMAIGAITGLVIILIFILPVKQPNPSWGELWMIRPLIITPLAGAFGSLIFYSTNLLRLQSQWKKGVLLAFSCLAFIVALWMGIVLGLAGTLWH